MFSPPPLTADTLNIWDVNLEQPDHLCLRLAELLSEDESARASAYYFERDRRRFTVARAGLRLLLGHYTNQDPCDVVFDYNPQGKPSVRGDTALQFNVSHSHERAVYAVGLGMTLGVDLEYMRPIDDLNSLARSTFSRREITAFDAVPHSLKPQAFFNCWTRKEAYIKALGEGLSHALDSFDVSLMPGEIARLLWVAEQPDEPNHWTLHSFKLGSDYVGALAVRQIISNFSIINFSFINF